MALMDGNHGWPFWQAFMEAALDGQYGWPLWTAIMDGNHGWPSWMAIYEWALWMAFMDGHHGWLYGWPLWLAMMDGPHGWPSWMPLWVAMTDGPHGLPFWMAMVDGHPGWPLWEAIMVGLYAWHLWMALMDRPCGWRLNLRASTLKRGPVWPQNIPFNPTYTRKKNDLPTGMLDEMQADYTITVGKDAETKKAINPARPDPETTKTGFRPPAFSGQCLNLQGTFGITGLPRRMAIPASLGALVRFHSRA